MKEPFIQAVRLLYNDLVILWLYHVSVEWFEIFNEVIMKFYCLL
jgi:hypothetical protein